MIKSAVALLCLMLVVSGRANATCEYAVCILEGRQVLPPTNLSWTGWAQLIVCDDRILHVQVPIEGSETVTAIHVHAPASPHENGPILFELLPPFSTFGNSVNSHFGPLTQQQMDWIVGLHGYLDVHTVEHPDGAVRGALLEEVEVAPFAWSHVKALYR